MRLSARDKEIVAHIGLHADETVPQLAKRCRVKSHTLRYVVARLIDQGLLKKRWVIDLMSCGWSRYEIFFSSSITAKKVRDSLQKDLIRSQFVTYFAEVGGDFDYELILLARDSIEVSQILGTLVEQYGDLSFSKAVVHHQQVHYFSRKYLSTRPPTGPGLSLFRESNRHILTALDHQILRKLSQFPDASQRELARLCDCAAPTIQSRIVKLRSVGVIRGALYSYSAAGLGAQNYIFIVYTKGFGFAVRDKLHQFCMKHPMCTNMKVCFGNWDYEIGVEAMNYQEVVRFKELLLETFSVEFQTVKILSRFTTHKYDFYPFQDQQLA